VVLGCTDICGLIDVTGPGEGPAVDSLACLAGRCVQALVAGAAVAASSQR
jgi:aspartate/glutamate racemase